MKITIYYNKCAKIMQKYNGFYISNLKCINYEL